jgi:pimeloyl-ACP methyl ester carboxylesterase
MGAGIALELAMHYPELVRRLIVASLAYCNDGFHPAAAAQFLEIAPDDNDLAGLDLSQVVHESGPKS